MYLLKEPYILVGFHKSLTNVFFRARTQVLCITSAVLHRVSYWAILPWQKTRRMFRGHEVLGEEPVGKELWEEMNRNHQEHRAWEKQKISWYQMSH